MGIVCRASGEVQLNPRPKDKSSSTFSIFQRNLNSIIAHNHVKVSLLEAYIAVHKFDTVWTSETYLDSSNARDDGNLEIAGYNLRRSDHPSNEKRGGVCICYKNFLPLEVLSILYLQKCIKKLVVNFVIFDLTLQVRSKINLKNFMRICKGL